MKILSTLTAAIDRVTEFTGRGIAWCAVAMVLVTCYIVVTRYAFNQGSIAVQESVIYLNALLFMLAAAFTLKHNGHVRVDIFYSRAPARYRAWVDLLGGLLLLLPVCVFIIWISWDYVAAAWAIRESSGEPGGLPYVYLLKTLIPVMGGLLIVQGVAEILRGTARLFPPAQPANRGVDPGSGDS